MLPEFVPSGCMPMPWAFFQMMTLGCLDHFDDRVIFVPDASVWVTAYRPLSALVFPGFLHILSTQVSDTGPMVLWLYNSEVLTFK